MDTVKYVVQPFWLIVNMFWPILQERRQLRRWHRQRVRLGCFQGGQQERCQGLQRRRLHPPDCRQGRSRRQDGRDQELCMWHVTARMNQY